MPEQSSPVLGLDRALRGGLTLEARVMSLGVIGSAIEVVIPSRTSSVVRGSSSDLVGALRAASSQYYASIHSGATEPTYSLENLDGNSYLNVLMRKGFILAASRERGHTNVQISREDVTLSAGGENFWDAYKNLCSFLYRVSVLGDN